MSKTTTIIADFRQNPEAVQTVKAAIVNVAAGMQNVNDPLKILYFCEEQNATKLREILHSSGAMIRSEHTR